MPRVTSASIMTVAKIGRLMDRSERIMLVCPPGRRHHCHPVSLLQGESSPGGEVLARLEACRDFHQVAVYRARRHFPHPCLVPFDDEEGCLFRLRVTGG